MTKLPFRSVLRPIRGLRILAFILQISSIALSLAQPLLIGRLLDAINAAAAGSSMQPVTRLSLILGGISLVDFVIYWMKDFYLAKTVAAGVKRMRGFMMDETLARPIRQGLGMEKGDVLNRLLNDAETYAHYLTVELPEFALIALRVAAIYIILFVMNPVLATTAAGIFTLYLTLHLLINRRLRARMKEERAAYSGVVQGAQETLDGFDCVKVNGQEKFFARRFGDVLSGYFSEKIRVQGYNSLSNGLLNFFYAIIPVVVLAVGASLVVSGRNSLGTVIAFYSYTHWIIEPVYTLADLNRLRQQALAALPRLKEMAGDARGEKKSPTPPVETLSLDRVSFHYREDAPLLQGLNLELKRGDRLAVTGRSGIGKTSLAHLILGLQSPISGEIRVNGLPLDSLEEESYLRRCAYLPQEVFLFSGSAKENIAFTKDPETWFEEAVSLSRLGFLNGREELTPGGLSGGEKQRLGLARAFYRKPDILICDEPTAALDEGMERLIVQGVDAYLKKHPCMFIVITHRKPVLGICDRVISLGEGEDSGLT